MSTDNITHHPQTGAEIVHPPADRLTPMRVETLLNFLPPGLATVTTFHSSRGQDMLVHDLRGGKRYVPHHMVTIKDLLRLVVEEEWRKHSTKDCGNSGLQHLDSPKGIVVGGGCPVRPALQGFYG